LTVQYQPIHNVTVEMYAVTETQSVFVTESKIHKGGNIVTEKTSMATESTSHPIALITLSPSKDVYEKRVKGSC
jgi:histidine ammonia-lyase